MEIIKPYAELWRQENPIAHIARCARVCYASNRNDKNQELYDRLFKSGHYSMFRHQSKYYIVPFKDYRLEKLKPYEKCPYIDYIVYDDEIYIATNAQFVMDNPDFTYFSEWEVDPFEFENTETGHSLMRWTFKIITQISTSRELNRVSPNNIAEQSTRYVNLSKKGGAICQPHWMSDETVEVFNTTNILPDGFYSKNEEAVNYCWHCDNCFQVYNRLISKGMLPQDARGVLPLDTATVCIYTYSYSEWKEIIAKRVYHTTGKAHPNAVIICKMIEDKLKELGYEFNF